MVEWSYIHPRKSTYQFQQGSAVENVSIWSLNLPSSRKLIVRFSAIFPALWPLTWHENCAKWGSSCYFIQLSAIYFKWWRKVIFVEKNTRSFRQDDQVTRHRQFREWRKTGVVPTDHTHTHIDIDGWCMTVVTPVLKHCSYHSLVPSHWYTFTIMWSSDFPENIPSNI